MDHTTKIPGMGDMKRISVVGSSGSGKSTVARQIAQRLGVPHIELDAVFHGPDWTPAEPEAFRDQVHRRLQVATNGWVADGNYSTVREQIWQQADTVVHLDLPRWQVMSRLVHRTVRRMITREELWNGNREPWSNLWSPNPEQNVIIWSWVNHRRYRRCYRSAVTDPQWSHLRFVRLDSPEAVQFFVDNL